MIYTITKLNFHTNLKSTAELLSTEVRERERESFAGGTKSKSEIRKKKKEKGKRSKKRQRGKISIRNSEMEFPKPLLHIYIKVVFYKHLFTGVSYRNFDRRKRFVR